MANSPKPKSPKPKSPKPKSPKPKSPKPKSKARLNPLRQGVSYNRLSNMLKNFAVIKRNNPEKFENINDKLKR